MSEIEAATGKIFPFLPEESKIEQVHAALAEHGINEFLNFSDALDAFYELEDFILIKHQVFRIEVTYLDAYGFTLSNKNPDGSIDFTALWYNGGGSISDVLGALINENGDKQNG